MAVTAGTGTADVPPEHGSVPPQPPLPSSSSLPSRTKKKEEGIRVGRRRTVSSSLSIRGPATVPLLEAISRSPEQTDMLVKEALHRWNVGSYIAIWVSRRWKQRFQQQHRGEQRQPKSGGETATTTVTRKKKGKRRRESTSSSTSSSMEQESRQMISSSSSGSSGTSPSSSSSTSTSGSSSSLHWLFTLLKSTSRTEQTAAIRLLCKGCLVKDEYSLWTLLQVIQYLIHECCCGGPNHHHSHSYPLSSSSSEHPLPRLQQQQQHQQQHGQRSDDAHILPLVALLQHIFILHRPTTAVGYDPTSLARAFLRKGLAWTTSMLWKATLDQRDASVAAFVKLLQQVLLFYPTTTTTGSTTTTTTKNTSATTSTTTTTLGNAGLQQAGGGEKYHHHHHVHSRLLWNGGPTTSTMGTTSSAVPTLSKVESSLNERQDSQQVVSSSKNSLSTLSPLISLIATYHVWKQRKSSLTPRQQDVLAVLQELVDPHTVPAARPSPSTTTTTTTTTTTNITDTIPHPRLWDTFFGCPSPTSTTTTRSSAVSRVLPSGGTTRSTTIDSRSTTAAASTVSATATTTTSTNSPGLRLTSQGSSSTVPSILPSMGSSSSSLFELPPLPVPGDTTTTTTTTAASRPDWSSLYAMSSNAARTRTNTNSSRSDRNSNNSTSLASSLSTLLNPSPSRPGIRSSLRRPVHPPPPPPPPPPPLPSFMEPLDSMGRDDDRFNDDDNDEDDDHDEDDDEDEEEEDEEEDGAEGDLLHDDNDPEEGEEEGDEMMHCHEDDDNDEEEDDNSGEDDHNHHDEDEEMEEYEELEGRNYEQDPMETAKRSGGSQKLTSKLRTSTAGCNEAKTNPSAGHDSADGGDGDDDPGRGGGGGSGLIHLDDEDQDEEIDSDDEEDDDCEYDHEDEEEDEHDIVIHGEEDDEDNTFRQRLLDLQDNDEYQRPPPVISPPACVTEIRKTIYLKACHHVLASLYPAAVGQAKGVRHDLSVAAEKDLLHSIMNILTPPKTPANSKIIMRRAPTQEDFFRGSLSRNPISLQQIKKDEEPTVRDLRQHIANDLQMGDSAELLEILVANKILDVDLKLRVVHQVLWKQHLMHSQQGGGGASQAGSALSQFLASGRTRSLISSRGGLSMIFSGVGLGSPDATGNTIKEDTPLADLPPMVITYRLTGVDGEATEDTVTTLDDPEAPSESADPKSVERKLEKEFGMTRLLTEGRGVSCLLKSLERNINDTLRRIRRDDVGNGENLTRNHFKTCKPYPGLTLLSCSAKLASNRELLLQARAPTILLRLLLDVLHALEGEGLSERNPTAKELQELIEILASDMLLSSMSYVEVREEVAEDASTLRLLLVAIETSSLSRPLRNVIAKLLPYLTYGQLALSKELASEFQRHFDETLLRDGDRDDKDHDRQDILMATFVHTSIALPANDVCNCLRSELIECGFVERIANFVLEQLPPEPPGWSACLWAKDETPETESLLKCWQTYVKRPGLKTAFDMLIGLCKGHGPTQVIVGNFGNDQGHLLIKACHWLESTSDNTSSRVLIKNLGLVAETLLDELTSEDSPVAKQVETLRTKTRDRKKEIAMERRNKTLMGMGTFGSKKVSNDGKRPADQISGGGPSVRGTAASLLAPVLGLFGNSEPTSSSAAPASKRRKTSKTKEAAPPTKPAWMTEMEDMEDETGLTCAVCQEGKTLQPSELLGLYAYVKKVSIPMHQCGGRNHIDGTSLLTSLPSLPSSLSDSHAALEWYPAARAVGEDLKESSRAVLSSMTSNQRTASFTTTVSAGNAIHFSCHNRARQVDRNHPKAPKSEWEGATLRNSRVKCNIIMPLVTSRSSQVPLVAVDVALTEHQTAISNLLGARPKSMLWNVLHDVRLLLLRMAYGEPLNVDCGGGSLLSNCQLVFHQLLMADMFEKDAQVDAPETAQHARHLSAGFLAAGAIAHASDYSKRGHSLLHRGIADSSTMAALTCILFHNTRQDYQSDAASAMTTTTTTYQDESPHPKRRWILGRDYFLRGLINGAGRRHASGIDSSGCSSTSTSGNWSSGNRRRRAAGFADWDVVDEADLLELACMNEDIDGTSGIGSASSRVRSATSSSSMRNTVDDFKDALRPMLVYFAMMDQLSSDFVLALNDIKVDDFANHLVEVINACNGCKTIRELLFKARVDLSDDEIIDELQRGMMAA